MFRLNKKKKQVETKNKQEMKNYITGVGACLVTKSLLNYETKLKWIFREENGIGNGWVAFGESDTQAYVDNADNYEIVDFNTLANIEPSVLHILYMPFGSDLEFVFDKNNSYFIDTKTKKEIREPVKSPVQIAFEKNLAFLRQDTYTSEFLQSLFQKTSTTEVITIGEVDFPSGEIIIADPLVYLYNEKYAIPLNRTIPTGSYPVELSICHSEMVGIRIVAARLIIKNETVEKYEIAMQKNTTIDKLNEPNILAGFGVDAGLGCFCDGVVAKEYDLFLQKWHNDNPNKNHYDDYFAEHFKQSYQQYPNVQRKDGDFIVWSMPETNHKIAMFASGMGDGFYTGHWGLDKNNEVCELIIPFMNSKFF